MFSTTSFLATQLDYTYMTQYMCLESGQDFATKEKAEEHAQQTHNLTLNEALYHQELFIEFDDDEDPEELYRKHVEN